MPAMKMTTKDVRTDEEGKTLHVPTHPDGDVHLPCPVLDNDTSGIDVVWSDDQLFSMFSGGV